MLQGSAPHVMVSSLAPAIHPSTTFVENWPNSFCVILLTDNQRQQKQSLKSVKIIYTRKMQVIKLDYGNIKKKFFARLKI